MTAVFSHGRLRLYLLKLLADGPKHGYEFIRLLQDRFLGLYAPSAGTIYPRLQRLEAEGLITHTAVGGRKVYGLTDAGWAELRQRVDELAALETEISASVTDLSRLATEIKAEVRGSLRGLKQELWDAAGQTQRSPRRKPSPSSSSPSSLSPSSPSPSSRSWPSRSPSAPGGQGASRAAPGGDGVGPGNGRTVPPEDRAAGLEVLLRSFVGEAREMTRDVPLTQEQLRGAAEVLDAALTRLRRLLT